MPKEKGAKLTFLEEKEDDMIIYLLQVNGKNVRRAELLGRSLLLSILSNPTNKGYGTKMLEYIENKALERGFGKIKVSPIKADKGVKRFFEKNGYKLTQNAEVTDEFDGEKSIGKREIYSREAQSKIFFFCGVFIGFSVNLLTSFGGHYSP